METVAGSQPVRSTRWCVVTGAPSSGITAVIVRMERLGCKVVHEAARAYIEEELNKGRTLQNIKSDPLDFERQIQGRGLADSGAAQRGFQRFGGAGYQNRACDRAENRIFDTARKELITMPPSEGELYILKRMHG